MAIPNNKTRLIVTLPDKLRSDLEYICELDKRTPSKELEYILEYFLSENFGTEEYIEKFNDYYNSVYKPELIANEILSIWKKIFGIPPFKASVNSYEQKLEDFKIKIITMKISKCDFFIYNKDNAIINIIQSYFIEHNIDKNFLNNIIDIIYNIFQKE